MKNTQTPQATPAGAQPLAFSITGAAAAIGVSRTTIYELVKAGKLHPVKIGTRTLIPRAELEALLAGGAK